MFIAECPHFVRNVPRFALATCPASPLRRSRQEGNAPADPRLLATTADGYALGDSLRIIELR